MFGSVKHEIDAPSWIPVRIWISPFSARYPPPPGDGTVSSPKSVFSRLIIGHLPSSTLYRKRRVILWRTNGCLHTKRERFYQTKLQYCIDTSIGLDNEENFDINSCFLQSITMRKNLKVRTTSIIVSNFLPSQARGILNS